MKDLRIALHRRQGSFSTQWEEYLQFHGLKYDILSAFSDDIVSKLRHYDLFLWHWSHLDFQSSIAAKQIMMSLSHLPILLFPDPALFWHFDDKLAQKYFLEAIGAPTAPSHVFYDRKTAHSFLEQCHFPIVWKLRGGAGSSNVKLIKNMREGQRYLKQAFGRGFDTTPSVTTDFRLKVDQARNRSSLLGKLKRLPRTLRNIAAKKKEWPPEKGYLLLQEFLPGNDYDTRILTIGNRAMGFRRFNRPGDFKASGSGRNDFDHEKIDRKMVDIALRTSREQGFAMMGYDFLKPPTGEPQILELGYGCKSNGFYYNCQGYWTADGTHHPGQHHPEHFILEDALKLVRSRKVEL